MFFWEELFEGEREREKGSGWIWVNFEGEIFVVLFKGFGGDYEVDLRVKLVKICEGFDWYD